MGCDGSDCCYEGSIDDKICLFYKLQNISNVTNLLTGIFGNDYFYSMISYDRLWRKYLYA